MHKLKTTCKMKFFILVLLCGQYVAGNLDTEWWKHTSIYEMIVHSFKDSDGDGIGDFKGVTSKLDYLSEDLGIETIYFTPIMESSMKDMGYDTSDYYKVNSMYGTMADFEELIKEMNVRGMKLIIDLVINHSGDEHEWFKKSINKIEPYTNYYIWANASGYDNLTLEPLPPNKWMNFSGGSAWTWIKQRQQFYYHKFMEVQPDLNLRNELVKEEVKKIVKFWLDKGVSGFRLDAPMCYFESEDLQDENGEDRHQEDIAFIHELRLILDDYSREHGGNERILVPETRTEPKKTLDYYGTKEYPVAQLAFQYIDIFHFDLPAILYGLVFQYLLNYLGKERIPAWVTECHDFSRIAGRMSPESTDIIIMMTMMLPGSVCLYYGQEISMRNGFIRPDQTRDQLMLGKNSRDPARLIMQWDDSLNAGFSTNMTTYLPSNSDYYERNVEMQKNQAKSHFNLIKTLLDLRKMETLRYGDVKFYARSLQTFVFWRTYKHNDTYIFVGNMGHTSALVNIKYLLWDSPQELTVVAASVNSEYVIGNKIQNNFKSKFPMRPLSCILLRWERFNVI